MKNAAIKKYLHQTSIGQPELELVKALMLETKTKLVDFLPEQETTKRYFLVSLLREGLKDFESNKSFIDEILSFKDESNLQIFYWELINHKPGLEIIKNRPELQPDKSKALRDILTTDTIKNIITYVNNNKNNINVEQIYKCSLKLNVVEALEKCGLVFDQRILDVIGQEANFRKPKELLKYISKYKEKTKEKNWNNFIIDMMQFLNRQNWDHTGRYKFQDAFGLITEVKNISQYKWGEKTDKQGFSCFSFNDSLSYFGSSYNYPKIFENQEEIKEKVKNLLKNNDIYFTAFNKELINRYIDQINPKIIEKAFHDNWKYMFRWDNKTNDVGFFNRYPILKDKDPLIDREDVKRILIKEYLSQRDTYKFNSWSEESSLTDWGMTKNSIGTTKFFKTYKDVLNMKTIEAICEIFKIDNKKKAIIETDYLSLNLHQEHQSTTPKKKI